MEVLRDKMKVLRFTLSTDSSGTFTDDRFLRSVKHAISEGQHTSSPGAVHDNDQTDQTASSSTHNKSPEEYSKQCYTDAKKNQDLLDGRAAVGGWLATSDPEQAAARRELYELRKKCVGSWIRFYDTLTSYDQFDTYILRVIHNNAYDDIQSILVNSIKSRNLVDSSRTFTMSAISEVERWVATTHPNFSAVLDYWRISPRGVRLLDHNVILPELLVLGREVAFLSAVDPDGMKLTLVMHLLHLRGLIATPKRT